MRLVASTPGATPILTGYTIEVACPSGCIRREVYFDGNAVADWLRARRRDATLEQFAKGLRCAVCGERPASVRSVVMIYPPRLAKLPGMD